LSVEQAFRKAFRFSPKNKIVLWLELGVPIVPIGFGSKKKASSWGARSRFKGVQVFPILQIHLMPIIHSGTAKLAIVHRKSQRLDQVQPASGCQTKTGDVAGIRRNLGFD
jgi:hypothetical protein